LILYFRYIVRKAEVKCEVCQQLLECTVNEIDAIQDTNTTCYRLLIQKDKGGLVYPSKFTVKLIAAAERVTRVYNEKLTQERLNLEVLKAVGGPPDAFVQHANDTQHGAGNHYFSLIRKVLTKFHNLRQFYSGKRINQAHHPTKNRVKRNKLTLVSGE
jgi:hypothetical protein